MEGEGGGCLKEGNGGRGSKKDEEGEGERMRGRKRERNEREGKKRKGMTEVGDDMEWYKFLKNIQRNFKC